MSDRDEIPSVSQGALAAGNSDPWGTQSTQLCLMKDSDSPWLVPFDRFGQTGEIHRVQKT